MTVLKKVFVICVVLFAFSGAAGTGFLGAQELPSLEELERDFLFSRQLRDYAQAQGEERAQLLEENRYVLLEGSLASISVLDPDPASFYVQTELINGQWDGLEDVEMFKGFVFFLGEPFVPRFPRRMPRDPGPEVIKPNSHVLILASLHSYSDEDGEGKAYPLFIGHQIRVIP
ncbi:MAG: hypothetical protein K9L68_15270 [Spirochaetales bacterium]|nr:hypothetical protein [Spirochaetales bacterium]